MRFPIPTLPPTPSPGPPARALLPRLSRRRARFPLLVPVRLRLRPSVPRRQLGVLPSPPCGRPRFPSSLRTPLTPLLRPPLKPRLKAIVLLRIHPRRLPRRAARPLAPLSLLPGSDARLRAPLPGARESERVSGWRIGLKRRSESRVACRRQRRFADVRSSCRSSGAESISRIGKAKLARAIAGAEA